MQTNNTMDFTTAPPNFVFNALRVNIVGKAKFLVTGCCISAAGLARSLQVLRPH
jgi:hypothetical protein